MKKTNNKGFSLVELIIVIAIMAILAGAIAPALIRYIDKSRKSNDVSSAKTIKTAVETALGNEDIYAYLTNLTATGDNAFSTITITPNQQQLERQLLQELLQFQDVILQVSQYLLLMLTNWQSLRLVQTLVRRHLSLSTQRQTRIQRQVHVQ